MTAAITDFNQYAELRAGAGQNDPAVLREVAGQFEALFIETMLKNMREASLGDPLLGDSNARDMFEGMLDQQLAVEMSKDRGIGLADMLVRQLGADYGDLPMSPAKPRWDNARSFARDIWPHAERAARRLDVAPEAIVAQAALETGWGTHVPQHRDGSSSNNLFGIKAGTTWLGERVGKPTLEFEDGIARREHAAFRAYADVAQTFDDYAALLADNPRYTAVHGHGDDIDGFAEALQDSGYATDPDYAAKIKRIAASDTMRDALRAVR